jgi:hypothetical protein
MRPRTALRAHAARDVSRRLRRCSSNSRSGRAQVTAACSAVRGIAFEPSRGALEVAMWKSAEREEGAEVLGLREGLGSWVEVRTARQFAA